MTPSRSTPLDPRRVVKNWIDMITEEHKKILLRLPPDAMTKKQRDTLRELASHFSNATADQSPVVTATTQLQIDGLTSGQDEDTLIDDREASSELIEGHKAPSKRGRPSNKISSTASWACIRTLKSLKLEDDLKQYFQNQETNASQFLASQDITTSLIPQVPNTSSRETLMTSYYLAKSMEYHTVATRIRWLYLMILIGDIGKKMFGKMLSLNADKTRDLRNFIIQRNAKMPQRDKTDLQLSTEAQCILEDVQTLMKGGEKLGGLCEKFGNGCIFWLYDHLSLFFIKERMTNTGEAYNHAMQVLGDLQLADKARESGANKLGDAIRTHLQEAYGVNRIGFGNAS